MMLLSDEETILYAAHRQIESLRVRDYRSAFTYTRHLLMLLYYKVLKDEVNEKCGVGTAGEDSYRGGFCE